MPAFAASFNVTTLNGSNGFVINGAAGLDESGSSVSSAGDVNGDGFADLLVGAAKSSPLGKLYAGAAFVVFGKASGFGNSFELSTLFDFSDGDGSSGFMIAGAASADLTGGKVSSAGDVNGDGIDDLLVGASYANPSSRVDAGSTYIIYGSATSPRALVNLSALDGSNGTVMNGSATGELSGCSVSSAGDINGDGVDDLLIGARLASPNGYGSGSSYVVFGKKGGLGNSLQLSDLSSSDGFEIRGATTVDYSGFSVSGVGDVNGDGIDDLLVGSPGSDAVIGIDAGSSYVVFGSKSAFPENLDVTALDGSNGFKLVGASALNRSGFSVSGAGDVNGDGLADMVISSRHSLAAGADEPGSFVVFGRVSRFPQSFDLNELNGTNGFKIKGVSAGINPVVASSAGDINGDGYADLLIGDTRDKSGLLTTGGAFVVFGKSGGFAEEIDLTTLNGKNGFEITGFDENSYGGCSVSSAGDVNGDGFDDLIVGAGLTSAEGKTVSGASYVIFGHANGAIFRQGTAKADILSGGEYNDTFHGLGGNDHIRAGAGADVLFGDGNDDRLIGGAGEDVMDGGSGKDVIDGGSDADVIRAGSGDDRILASRGLDFTDGGTGIDTFDFVNFGSSTVNLNLSTGLLIDPSKIHQTVRNIENVIGSAGADRITGDGSVNKLQGGDGKDVLTGGGGKDTLIGGNGSDTYFVERTDEVITETSSSKVAGGDDLVHYTGSSGTFILGKNIERLTLDGTAAINGTGNSLANVLSGNAGKNALNGGSGYDRLIGGLGGDSLTGGSGVDRFEYHAKTEGGDKITDFGSSDFFTFSSASFGKLAKGALTDTHFVSRLADHTAQTKTDLFIFNQKDDTLWFDADGSGKGSAVLIADLQNNFNLHANDIVII